MRVNRPKTEPPTLAADPEGLEDFAAQRGLPIDFLGEHGLHIAQSGRYVGWLVIPYPHMTGTWGNRYRNLRPGGEPKYMSDEGAGVHLYNPQRLGPNADAVVLCEGELDTLVLTYLGFPAVGIPGANTFRRTWKLLFADALVVAASDADKAGDDMANGIMSAFSDSTRLRPPGGMDIGEWYLDDPEGLTSATRRALRWEESWPA